MIWCENFGSGWFCTDCHIHGGRVWFAAVTLTYFCGECECFPGFKNVVVVVHHCEGRANGLARG